MSILRSKHGIQSGEKMNGKPCDNNKKFDCPVNEEGRNRTCRKDGLCAIADDDSGCRW
jgi:hypothetical protein